MDFVLATNILLNIQYKRPSKSMYPADGIDLTIHRLDFLAPFVSRQKVHFNNIPSPTHIKLKLHKRAIYLNQKSEIKEAFEIPLLFYKTHPYPCEISRML
jgi:hypothetical protein